MVKDIIILGTGSNSLEILETAQHAALSAIRVVGFLDDGMTAGEEVNGVPVLGRLEEATRFDGAFFVNGIGSPGNFAKRDTFIAKTQLADDRFISIIHPSASVSPRATIGHGVVLFQNVVIGTGAVLGNHVIVLPQATVSHDTNVGAYTCIATGAVLSGGCTIGESSYLGARCVTRENIQIGSGSLIGAGAVVVKNIKSQTVAVGNPARPL